jgi:nucleoside-diphosphate-sugar epimerase
LKKVLVTGANGFLGRAISAALLEQGFDVLCATRSPYQLDGAKTIIISALEEQTDWAEYLAGVDCVIHTAARVHIARDTAQDSYDEFQKVNVIGTLNLAQQAAQCGVGRFIFISSIGVNGKQNTIPFLETDKPNPQGSYAISKQEAEQELLSLAKNTGLQVVIIRPPLVYGDKAPGNFGSLVRWVSRGVPLPLGAVNNKRSFVALDNLVSFIVHCISHPKAANEIFLISDGEDVSTKELIKRTAKAFGKRSMLVPAPVSLMEFAAKLIGKEELATRLFGPLQVDSTKARELLGWKPVITMDGQLQKTADAYGNEKTV